MCLGELHQILLLRSPLFLVDFGLQVLQEVVLVHSELRGDERRLGVNSSIRNEERRERPYDLF